jgi:dolichyl-phosphate beta-glucosyltransferase
MTRPSVVDERAGSFCPTLDDFGDRARLFISPFPLEGVGPFTVALVVLPIPPEQPATSPQELTTTIVIPCFNEAERLDRPAVLALAESGIRILLVNDGSTDTTGLLLDELASRCRSIEALHLATNQGKGEAVRLGLLRALRPDGTGPGPDVVGYFDADFATPSHELLRLVEVLTADRRLRLVAASRYEHRALVNRRADRRLLGVVFSGLARRALGIPMRDTQCGAKVMRADHGLRVALRTRFTGRWSFDIELLDRLLRGGAGVPGVAPRAIVEMPLMEWNDMAGSKLGVLDMAGALFQVVRLGTARGWRRRPADESAPLLDLTIEAAGAPLAALTD